MPEWQQNESLALEYQPWGGHLRYHSFNCMRETISPAYSCHSLFHDKHNYGYNILLVNICHWNIPQMKDVMKTSISHYIHGVFEVFYRMCVYPNVALIQSSYNMAGNRAVESRVLYSVREQGTEQPHPRWRVTFPLNSSVTRETLWL